MDLHSASFNNSTRKLYVSRCGDFSTVNVCIFLQISDDADEEEVDKYTIEISVKDPKKVGDGMNAYMAYKVMTKVQHWHCRNSCH